MYGRYTKELGDYVKGTQNIPAPVMHGNVVNEEFSRYGGKISSTLEVVWRHSFAKLSEDWVFLTLLGLVMAVLSFVMDYGIDFTNEGQYCNMQYRYKYLYRQWCITKIILAPTSDAKIQKVPPITIPPCNSNLKQKYYITHLRVPNIN